ncbi:hypothetical protein [Sphingobium chungangianum]
MRDHLGPGAKPPFAMLVEAPHMPGRVDRVGRRDDRALGEQPQAHRHAEVGNEADGAVGVGCYATVAREVFGETVERLLRVDAPDDLMDAVAVDPRIRRKRRVSARPDDDI